MRDKQRKAFLKLQKDIEDIDGNLNLTNAEKVKKIMKLREEYFNNDKNWG